MIEPGTQRKAPVDAPPPVSALVERATRELDRAPYATVGAAFVVGYLLSGALLSVSTLRVLLFGVRLMAMPEVQRRVLEVVEPGQGRAR